MKLTKHQLQKIILEELNNVLKEVRNPFDLEPKYDLVDIMRAFEKGRSKPIPAGYVRTPDDPEFMNLKSGVHPVEPPSLAPGPTEEELQNMLKWYME